MAQFCSVCIPVALPPGVLLPLKEGLPLPPVSLAGFLRPLLRGMPAWQEDTTAKVLRSLHCLAAGPTSAVSFLLKGQAGSAPYTHQSLHCPWWCSAEISQQLVSSEHRGGNGVWRWERVCVWGNLVGDGAFGPKSSGTWDDAMGSFLSLQEQQGALG